MKNLIQRQKSNSKKRHFQLLEIMVAMVLIVLCAAPALKIYTNMYKQQTEIVRNYEADHLVHIVHSKIIERMYKNIISFDDILMGDERSFEDKDLTSKLKKMGYSCNYTIRKINARKVAKEHLVRYLFELNITLVNQTDAKNNRNYHYDHFVNGPAISGVILEEEQDVDIKDKDATDQADAAVTTPGKSNPGNPIPTRGIP